MSVLVDTSIWSLALRRTRPLQTPHVQELNALIKERRVQIIGPIRQEILSGVRSNDQFDQVQQALSAFSDIAIITEDYELAASYFNMNRSQGIQGSNTDFLICSVSVREGLSIFTTDRDFQLFQQHVPIKLHHSRFDP